MPVGRRTTSLLRIVVVVVALGLSFVVAAAVSFSSSSSSSASSASCPRPAFLPHPSSRFQAGRWTRTHGSNSVPPRGGAGRGLVALFACLLGFWVGSSQFLIPTSSPPSHPTVPSTHPHHHRTSLLPTRIRHSNIMPPSSSSSSPSKTFLAASPQDTTDSPSPTLPLPLTTLLPAGGALLALATTIGHLTTEGPVERTLVSTLVICSVLAAIAFKDTLPLPSFLRGRGGREGGEKLGGGGEGAAAPGMHVLSLARQMEFSSFQTKFLVIQLMATFIDFIQGPYLYKVYENYGFGMVGGREGGREGGGMESVLSPYFSFEEFLGTTLSHSPSFPPSLPPSLPPSAERHRLPLPPRLRLLRSLRSLRRRTRRHLRPAAWLRSIRCFTSVLLPPPPPPLLPPPRPRSNSLWDCHFFSRHVLRGMDDQ